MSDATDNFHIRTSAFAPRYQAEAAFPDHTPTAQWLKQLPLDKLRAGFDCDGYVKVRFD